MSLPARIKASLNKDRIKAALAMALVQAKRIPKSTLYAGVSLLLLLGWLSSVSDLLARGDKERAYAEKHNQRIVFLGDKSRAGETISKEPLEDDFEVEEESPEEKKLRELEKKNSKIERDDSQVAKDSADHSVDHRAPSPQQKDDGSVAKNEDKPVAEVVAERGEEEDSEPLGESGEAAAAADSGEGRQPAATAGASPKLIASNNTAILQQTDDTVVPIIHRGAKSLVFAPAREITKETKSGAVPKISASGTRASDLYAKGYRPDDSKSALGIMITGVGFSARSLNLLLAMPDAVTASFSPYAPDAASYIETIRNAGHEVWVDLPVQTKLYPAQDPGPYGVIASLTKKANAARVAKVLAISLGAVGVVLPPEQTLSRFNSVLDFVLDTVEKHGLYVHFSQTKTPKTRSKARLGHSDIIIDAAMEMGKFKLALGKVAQQLSLEEKAKPLIISMPASVHHLRELKRWLDHDVKKLPVKIAPISFFYVDHEAIAQAEKEAAAAAEKDKGGGGH